MSIRTKYKTAREMSPKKLSQAEAAFQLYMSEGNLRRIENGQQKCSPDTADAMAALYDAPWVADPNIPIDYCPIQRDRAVLRYINEREDVEKLMPRARRLLANGDLDKASLVEFTAIAKEIQDECTAARDLLYAR